MRLLHDHEIIDPHHGASDIAFDHLRFDPPRARRLDGRLDLGAPVPMVLGGFQFHRPLVLNLAKVLGTALLQQPATHGVELRLPIIGLLGLGSDEGNRVLDQLRHVHFACGKLDAPGIPKSQGQLGGLSRNLRFHRLQPRPISHDLIPLFGERSLPPVMVGQIDCLL